MKKTVFTTSDFFWLCIVTNIDIYLDFQFISHSDFQICTKTNCKEISTDPISKTYEINFVYFTFSQLNIILVFQSLELN